MNDENKFLDCKGRKVSVGDMVRPLARSHGFLGDRLCRVIELNANPKKKPFVVQDADGKTMYFNSSWTELIEGGAS